MPLLVWGFAVGRALPRGGRAGRDPGFVTELASAEGSPARGARFSSARPSGAFGKGDPGRRSEPARVPRETKQARKKEAWWWPLYERTKRDRAHSRTVPQLESETVERTRQDHVVGQVVAGVQRVHRRIGSSVRGRATCPRWRKNPTAKPAVQKVADSPPDTGRRAVPRVAVCPLATCRQKPVKSKTATRRATNPQPRATERCRGWRVARPTDEDSRRRNKPRAFGS